MERRFASDRREIVVARWKDRERETFPRNGTAIIKGEGRGGGGAREILSDTIHPYRNYIRRYGGSVDPPLAARLDGKRSSRGRLITRRGMPMGVADGR